MWHGQRYSIIQMAADVSPYLDLHIRQQHPDGARLNIVLLRAHCAATGLQHPED